MTETFEGLTLLRYKGKNTFKHAVPKGSETSWQSCSNYVFLNTENQLCFILLLLSANCSVTVQTSVIFISLLEIASIYLLAELDTLTFERCATDFESFRSKKEEQFWTVFMIHFHFVL